MANMSEDVTGITLQVTERAITNSLNITGTVVSGIFRALRDISQSRMQKKEHKLRIAEMENRNELDRQRLMDSKMRTSDLTDIQSGRVSLSELDKNCRMLGDSRTMSQNAFTKADMHTLEKKAQEFGIPIAFANQNSKDNIYACVRTNDLPVFKQICAMTIKEKMAKNPQSLGGFKCAKWEVPFLSAEMSNFDLSVHFVSNKQGEHICVYDKTDAEAIDIVRKGYEKKCTAVKNDVSFSKDEQGFYVIQEVRSGKSVTFDTVPNKEILSLNLQKEFGFDENKADLCTARWGEEMLQGNEKKQFFSDSAKSQFSEIKSITFEEDNVLTKPYDCYYMTSKIDNVPRVVFRNENGNFAVLNPEKQSRKDMRAILAAELGVTDLTTQSMLVEKAERTSDYFKQQITYSHNVEFSKGDFDWNDPNINKGMHRTDENGNTFTKTLPISKSETQIQRTDNEKFRVNSTVTAVETDQNGTSHSVASNALLILSFSDKRDSIQQIKDMYMRQGVPEDAAKHMAKEVFQKAEMQSAEKTIHIEEVRSESVKVSDGLKTATIPTAEREEAVTALKEQFDIPEHTAAAIVEKTNEIRMPDLDETMIAENQTNNLELKELKEVEHQDMKFLDESQPTELSEMGMGSNGHEQHPEANILTELKQEAAVPEIQAVPELPIQMSELTVPPVPDVPPMSMGGR